jgi:hypothetical protein
MIALGFQTKIALVVGFVIGAGAANLDAHLRKIPTARAAEREAVVAYLEAEGAKRLVEALEEAREIEKGVKDATDEDLRRVIGGDPR